MSVRRLAADDIQPDGFEFSPENKVWAEQTINNYPPGKQASAVILLLWRAQEQHFGWLPKPAMEYVGRMLDMPFIRVYEVATFYTMFQLSPVGRKAHVQVCGTTPCMLRGAEDLVKLCKRKIAASAHTLSADGDFSWEEVECLGACVNAPMVQIFKDTFEDLTPQSLERILDDIADGKAVRPGSQIERHNSAPAGGFTTLVDPDLYRPDAVMKPGAQMRETAPAMPLPAGKGQAGKPVAKKPAAKKPTAKKPVAEPPQPEARSVPARKPAPATKAEARKPVATKPAAKKPAPATKVEARKPVATKPAAKKPAPAVKVEARKPVAKKPAAKKPAPAARAEAKPAPSGGKPRAMKKPAKPDDLKLISGVGPKLEGVLNDLGIYKWHQIAKWGKAQVDWVDDYLSFKGRIERDNWVDQADALATGGADEYQRRFGKKPK